MGPPFTAGCICPDIVRSPVHDSFHSPSRPVRAAFLSASRWLPCQVVEADGPRWRVLKLRFAPPPWVVSPVNGAENQRLGQLTECPLVNSATSKLARRANPLRV